MIFHQTQIILKVLLRTHYFQNLMIQNVCYLKEICVICVGIFGWKPSRLYSCLTFEYFRHVCYVRLIIFIEN